MRWNSLSNFIEESIWGKISDDVTIKSIDIDEDEFLDLFQAEIGTVHTKKVQTKKKTGVSVRVIDPKRANNGGTQTSNTRVNAIRLTNHTRTSTKRANPRYISSLTKLYHREYRAIPL